MGRTERTGSARNSRRNRPYVRCLRPRIRYSEQGEERPLKQRLPHYLPQSPPTHSDSRRQKTTARVGQTGKWRWRPTPHDTADWASKTTGRRCDSCPTCPSLMLNSCRLQPHRVQPVFRALTSFDPMGAAPVYISATPAGELRMVPQGLYAASLALQHALSAE
jgi:hypothetical protein